MLSEKSKYTNIYKLKTKKKKRLIYLKKKPQKNQWINFLMVFIFHKIQCLGNSKVSIKFRLNNDKINVSNSEACS